MSDQFDTLLERMRGQTPPRPFASPDAVRRRGRRLAHRRAAVLAALVLATGGTGAGIAAAVVEPVPGTPVAAPTQTTAPPIWISPQWLLTTDDLGPGRWQATELEWTEGSGSFPPLSCMESTTDRADRRDLRSVAWATGPVGEESNVDWVQQIVMLYAPGDGAAALAAVREGVSTCTLPDGRPGDSEPEQPQLRVVDSGFAGDESILIRSASAVYGNGEAVTGQFVTYLAVVRVEDTIVALRAHDAERPGVAPDRLRDLAGHAATRVGSTG